MGRTAILLVLSLVVVMGIMGSSLRERSSSATESNYNYYQQTQARNVAAAGLMIAIKDLRANNSLTGSLPTISLSDVTPIVKPNGTGVGWYKNHGTATVTITPANALKDTMELSSTGYYADAPPRTIRALVYNTGLSAPQPKGAICVAFGSKAKFKLDKDADISGLNHKLDGSGDNSDPTKHTNGISLGHISQSDSIEVPRDPKTGKSLVKIKGKGSVDGDPNDIVVGMGQDNYYDWAKHMAARADVVLRNKEVKTETVLGTVTNPQVTLVTGNTNFNQKVTGAGVLIVQGKLKIGKDADFKFVGLVIAVGDSLHGEESVSMGRNSRIVGALLVGGYKTKVKLSNTADVYYSWAALQLSANAILARSNYSVVGWWE